MKRISALIMVTLMVIGLSACGNDMREEAVEAIERGDVAEPEVIVVGGEEEAKEEAKENEPAKEDKNDKPIVKIETDDNRMTIEIKEEQVKQKVDMVEEVKKQSE